MEPKSSSHRITHDNNDAIAILRSVRDVLPAHYTLKIDSFSLFLKNKVGNYESGVFEAGGYKWRLSLYPNGNKNKNVDGHISLYLAMADIEKLPLSWEVNVNFKFLVFDHIRDKYLTIQGVHRRFHRMKTQWGFDQLIPLDTFSDESNGYLLDDCCVFGAEIFVIKYNGKGECASMIKNPAVNSTYTWRIDKYSALTSEYIVSDEFFVGENKWKLWFYPRGVSTQRNKCLSVYLVLADASQTRPGEKEVYAEYKLRIRDQVQGNHVEKEANRWFNASSTYMGFPDFLPINDLYITSKGLKTNDVVIVEAQITLISTQF